MKLSKKVGILSYFDPHARPAKKEDYKECSRYDHDHATIETQNRNATIETNKSADSRRLKFEKKFPKEKQDAIKSLINKDEQYCKDVDEEVW